MCLLHGGLIKSGTTTKLLSALHSQNHNPSQRIHQFSASMAASETSFLDWGSLMTGWWFEPLWKIWKSIGMIVPNISGKIKFMATIHHQPDDHWGWTGEVIHSRAMVATDLQLPTRSIHLDLPFATQVKRPMTVMTHALLALPCATVSVSSNLSKAYSSV